MRAGRVAPTRSCAQPRSARRRGPSPRPGHEVIHVAGPYIGASASSGPVPEPDPRPRQPDQDPSSRPCAPRAEMAHGQATIGSAHGRSADPEIARTGRGARRTAGRSGAVARRGPGDRETLITAYAQHRSGDGDDRSRRRDLRRLRPRTPSTAGSEGRRSKFWIDLDEVSGTAPRRKARGARERGGRHWSISTLVLEGRGSGAVTEAPVALHIEVDEHGALPAASSL